LSLCALIAVASAGLVHQPPYTTYSHGGYAQPAVAYAQPAVAYAQPAVVKSYAAPTTVIQQAPSKLK
jgi:hypothetical protein